MPIGIDGGDTVAQVFLSGHSLNEFCKKKPEKPTGARAHARGGGGGGGGGEPDPQDPGWNPGNGDSIGDPHLKTFDGFRFDFQRIGEYTLVRSTKDDFVVQVRQVPVPGSRAVSVNQSMATKIGGKRVTVSLENGDAMLRIDGAVVTGDPPAMPGVSLTRAQTSYGDDVRVRVAGRHGRPRRTARPVRPSTSACGRRHHAAGRSRACSATTTDRWTTTRPSRPRSPTNGA